MHISPVSAVFSVHVVLVMILLTITTGAAAADAKSISSEYLSARLVVVAEGIAHPWAVGFLPDGRMLVTERAGKMYLVQDGDLTLLEGIPEVYASGQGGLLDVVVHPDYENNGWIYLTYSKGDADGTVPALARARLEGARLVDLETIFESNTVTTPGRHYGSRILFLEDGTLLMSIGDRGAFPPRAQDPLDHSGSLVRLNPDGSTPADNPFVGDEKYAPEIYSYGHRNIQGLARHPGTGEVWATEHGPRGGDELNLIKPGRNYGWPTVTLGRDYPTEDKLPESRARSLPDMEDPVYEFLPTLAPSGLAVVDSERFKPWQGNLLAGGLRAERVLRIRLEGHKVVHIEELLLGLIGRIRDIRQGPDGYIYLLTDEPNGGLYRLEPAD